MDLAVAAVRRGALVFEIPRLRPAMRGPTPRGARSSTYGSILVRSVVIGWSCRSWFLECVRLAAALDGRS
jgi:hypothetical protein